MSLNTAPTATLITATPWHNKVNIAVNMPGLGIILMDRSPLQARRLAVQLSVAATAAELANTQPVPSLDPQATEAAHQAIEAEAAKLFGSGPAEKRARATRQAGSILVDVFVYVGIAATALGFALRALAI